MKALPPTHQSQVRAATRLATELTDRGQLVSAAEALTPVLAEIDPVTAPADSALIAAATAYAFAGDQDREQQLTWGRYAYDASQQVWGRDHDLTLPAAQTWADVLQRQDLSSYAIDVLTHVAALHSRRGDLRDELKTRRELAGLLHTDGRCEDAEQQIATALAAWRPHQHNSVLHRDGALLVMTRVVLLAGCGHHHCALNLLSRAQPILELADQGWRVSAGIRCFTEITATMAAHIDCTRAPDADNPSVATDAELAGYRRLLYDSAGAGRRRVPFMRRPRRD